MRFSGRTRIKHIDMKFKQKFSRVVVIFLLFKIVTWKSGSGIWTWLKTLCNDVISEFSLEAIFPTANISSEILFSRCARIMTDTAILCVKTLKKYAQACKFDSNIDTNLARYFPMLTKRSSTGSISRVLKCVLTNPSNNLSVELNMNLK